MKKTIQPVLILLSLCSFCYSQQRDSTKDNMSKMATSAASPFNIALIEQITGMKGKENGGQYKITVAQNDLNVTVDGFKIIPPMGLGSWVAFTPSPEGAMIMGDIILTETDLAPVQQEVIRQGLTISAIHNHFIRNHPNVMYMHIGGMGKTDVMAEKAKSVFDKVKEVRNDTRTISAARRRSARRHPPPLPRRDEKRRRHRRGRAARASPRRDGNRAA